MISLRTAIRLQIRARRRSFQPIHSLISYSTSTIFTRVLDFTNKLNLRLADNGKPTSDETKPDTGQMPNKLDQPILSESIDNFSNKIVDKAAIAQPIIQQNNSTVDENDNEVVNQQLEITTVINAFKSQTINPSTRSVMNHNEEHENHESTDTLTQLERNGQSSNEETLRKRLSIIASIFTSESEFLMQLMLDYPSLLALQKERAQDIIHHLHTIGMERNHICDNPWLFCLKNPCLEEKVWVINAMQEKHSRPVDLDLLIPLLNIAPQTMRLYLSKFMQNKEDSLSFCLTFKKRIRFLCKELEILPQYCHQLLEDHQVILTKPLEELQELVLLIKNEGKVKANDLVRDIWVLRHNCDRIKSRIVEANKLCVPFRPWMGRCNEEAFHNRCERYVKERLILNGRTVSEFIAQRLEVPEQDVQRLVIDSERIESVSVEKLDTVLQALLDAKVDKYFILNNIKMVEFSSPTLLKRIRQLRQVFGSDEHLNLIYLDRRSYERRFLSLSRKHFLYEQASRVFTEEKAEEKV